MAAEVCIGSPTRWKCLTLLRGDNDSGPLAFDGRPYEGETRQALFFKHLLRCAQEAILSVESAKL
jgi:hypothetical protein